MYTYSFVFLGADIGTAKQDIQSTAEDDDASVADVSTFTTELSATEHIPEFGNSSKAYGEGQCPGILHGEPLTDRKSTFQAHVASVRTKQEVRELVVCVL